MTYSKSTFRPVTEVRILSVALAAFATLALSNSASGITWSDEQLPDDPIDFLSSDDKYFQSNFVLDGFNPATMVINSATAYFWFADDTENNDRLDNSASRMEYVKISLGGLTLLNNLEVDGTHNNIPTSYDQHDAGLTQAMLNDLKIEGAISFKVEVLKVNGYWGDTYLKRAKIVVQGEYKNVPDGGSTVLLLGMCLLGMGTIARRRVLTPV